MVDKLGRVPREGERIKLRGCVLEVARATRQGVKRVRIIKR
jgi:CBS domain containing-hemolysin-like protein